ncbi:MAG TPA: NADH-quinone oxidoreductase subunit L, partial [Marinobacter hydrocarbonoclasticus]|nr:NADH-quinone oxidoreductase subunit L [Marinobacter nauticus]
RTLVRPWQALVRVLRFDFINLGMNLPAVIARLCNAGLVRSQDGQLRTYAKVMVFGATVILVGLVMTQGGGA